MPRGFLIKRKRDANCSWETFVRAESDIPEPLPPINAETEVDSTSQGSPDSGYAQSPGRSGVGVDDGSAELPERRESTEDLSDDYEHIDIEDTSAVDSAESACTDQGMLSVSDNDAKSTDSSPVFLNDSNGNVLSKDNLTNAQHMPINKKHETNPVPNSDTISSAHRSQFPIFNMNFNAYRRHMFGMDSKSSPSTENHDQWYNAALNPYSRLSVNTALYGSPFYWAAFNKMALNSPFRKQTSPMSDKSSGSLPESIHTPTGFRNTNGSSPGKRKLPQTPSPEKPKTAKKPKSARKITFEEEWKSSPVSGTYIRDDKADGDEDGIRVVSGDIDSSMNCVEITPEAEAELAKIENKIGDYICKLCKEYYENAFELAQHRCPRIVHIEYRCPECDKVFNCPANLASHRRWHKPRGINNSKSNSQKISSQTSLSPANSEQENSNASEECPFECMKCGKRFRRQTYLRKHMLSHSIQPQPLFSCSFCHKTLKSESERAVHIMNEHTVMGKQTNANRKLNELPLTNSSIVNRSDGQENGCLFACKFCTGTFFSAYGLERHMDKFHHVEKRQILPFQFPLHRTC